MVDDSPGPPASDRPVYRISGLDLASDLAFPLAAQGREGEVEPDVVLRVASRRRPLRTGPSGGHVPDAFPARPFRAGDGRVRLVLRRADGRPFLTVVEGTTSPDREGGAPAGPPALLFRYHGQADFLLEGSGRRISAIVREGVSEARLRCFFTGLVLSAVLRRLDRLALHATAVELGGGVAAFVAPPGAGKSTLAGFLVARGHALLSDDLLPLVLRGGAVEAVPSWPQLRLWPDVAGDLWGGREDVVPVHDGALKLALSPAAPPDAALTAAPCPLAAVYLLERRPAGDAPGPVRITPVDPRTALLELVASVPANFLSDGPALGQQLGQLAEVIRRVPCRRLRFSSGLDRLEDVYQAVVRDCDV